MGGLLGVDLDEIRRRDFAEQRRQKRIWQAISAAMSLLALVAAASGAFWFHEYRERNALLERTRNHLEKSLARAADLVEKSARTNDQFGVPVHVVEDFMDDAQSFIADAEQMLKEVQQLGDVTVDLKRAQGRALLNFARVAAKLPKGRDKSGQAEQLARAAERLRTARGAGREPYAPGAPRRGSGAARGGPLTSDAGA